METLGTIVVVDDEADVSRYLAAALEDEGFTVHVGANAREGLALIRDIGPGLICLDLVMPGRTGLSLYREVRDIPELAGIPIVVVTGVAPADAKDRLGLSDPDAYVEKPVDIVAFLATVRRLVSTGRRQS
jgi:DNA-binding response OmpR family regulator